MPRSDKQRRCLIHEYFCRNVRERRLELKMNQTDLAQTMDPPCDRSYVADIERGRASPTLELVERISKALHIEASKLISPNCQN